MHIAATARNWLIFMAVLIGLPLLASRIVSPRWVPLAALLGMGLLARLSVVNDPVAQVLEMFRHPTPASLRRITLLVWALSVAYLTFTAFHQHRDLFPRLHDEHCYLIQSRLIASGRLWMPQHELADFFDNFYLLSRPVYAPIYFPGTALLNAPFVKFGLPYWMMPVLASGLAAALTYYIVSVLIDGVAGLIAVAAAIGNWGFREFSTIVMAQAPMTLLGLLMVCTWLAWRRQRKLRWAILLGGLSGLAAITRPVDAVAFAAPICIAIILDWRSAIRSAPGCSSASRSKRLVCACFSTALAILVGIAPFLLLQAYFNQAATGSMLKTPYTLYLQNDQPGSEFGFHPFHPDARPASILLQKRLYFENLRLDEIRRHTLFNLPREAVRRAGWTIFCTLPAILLGILLPVALFGLTDRYRWVFWSAAPLFVLLYLFNPFFLVHYSVPLVPIMAFSIALAVHVLSRGCARTATYFTLIVLAVCVGSLPEFRSDIRDGTVPAMPLTALASHQLASAVDGPAVVLFRYRPADNPVEDPVYNDDVTYPDDAPVIRAHDLGARNIEIARYYAVRQPQRKFYLLDRQENAGRTTIILHPLGSARKFMETLEANPRAGAPLR